MDIGQNESAPEEKRLEHIVPAGERTPGENTLNQPNLSPLRLTVENEKIDNRTFSSPFDANTSNGSDASAHESQPQPAKAEAATDTDVIFAHLPDHEQQILKAQVNTPAVQVNFLSLYRYASNLDLLIVFIAVICSIAAGVALPLFTIFFGDLASVFQGVSLNTITYDDFYHELTKNVLYFVYIGIAEFGAVGISMLGFIYTGEHISQKIREQYLRAILRQNIGYFDKLGAGEITTRITADTNLIQDGISEKIGLTLTAVASLVTAFVIAYVQFWKLALICSSTLVALLCILGGSGQFVTLSSKKTLASYGVGGSVAEEVLSSIRTTVAFGTQDKLAEQYEVHLKTAEKWGARLQISIAFIIGGMYGIIYLNYGLGFWMGSRFLVDGDMNVGQVVTVLLAILIGSLAFGNVTPYIQAFTTAVAAAAKIYSTIDRPSPLDPMLEDGHKLNHVEGTIELRNVKHIYPSRPEVTIMNDVSLVIPAGKTTAFVGPSGSGKSTIIGLVERFYTPVGGSIFLDGHDIQSFNLRWLRQQISLVSQEPILFGTSIYENIAHGLIGSGFENEPQANIRGRIEDAARVANAHDFIMGLPEGYDTNVGERGFLLSGGQKQRIAIARAIVSDPKILLLDEATSALDTKSEGVVQAALDKAAAGRTTIVIAHRLSTIKTAHNIIVIVGGKVEEQGTHDQLVDRNGTYLKLVEAQRINDEKNAQATDEDGEEKEIENAIMKDCLSRAASMASDVTTSRRHTEEIKRTETRKSLSSIVLSKKAAPVNKQNSLWTLIKFTASLNQPELHFMLIGLLFSVLGGGGQPTQGVLIAKAITALSLPSSEYTHLKQDASFWSLMFLMLGIILFFCHVIQGIAFGIGSERLVCRARSLAFRAMLRQDIAFFDQDENSTGALTSFLSITAKHLSGISGVTLGTILTVITILIASFLVALIIGWKLALVCIAVVPLLLGCGFYRFWILGQLGTRSKRAYEESGGYACEATSAIRTVASLTREDDVLVNYRLQLRRQAKQGLVAVINSSFLYAASQALGLFCMALGFWWGGVLLGRHEYSTFQFFVCFTEVIFGAQNAGTVFSFAPDMGKAKNAAAELKKLLDRKPSIDVWSSDGVTVEDIEGTIEFRDVHFRYPTRPEQPVLRGLNLTIKPGQYVALVGASGCGKSTTIALLERFYDVLSGGIYVDGKDISQLNISSYRSFLSLVSQEPTLYRGTIRENILLGTNKDGVPEEAVIKACKDANIYDFIISLPEGFSTVVGSKGAMLSGGQKQRIAIARALIRNPKVLLLDEATSALDSESEKVVQAALDAAAQGRTTIAVAHRLSTIQKADIIYVFDQGRIIESGTHSELLRNKGRYYELVSLQDLGKTCGVGVSSEQ